MSEFNLTAADLSSLLIKVAADLKTHSEELRQLDAKAGDGDLGVTIELASKGMTDYLKSAREEDPGRLLAQCGMAINKISPSTFGTILASGFMGAGKSIVGQTEIGLDGLVLAGEGAIEYIKKRGKAEAGDKTVLDSLIPAVETLKQKLNEGAGTGDIVTAIIDASEAGLKATVNMKAKFGRAQWFKEGSLGIQDAGATAMFYLIQSFCKHLQD